MNRILIVEDEKPILNLIRMNLMDAGYDCLCAENGLEAANILEKERFDLILLDIMLPEIDGYELLEYIRPMEIPVIFITAKSDVMDRVRGLRLGAEDYITKPFRIQELRARVAAHLRREKREHHSTLSFEPDIRFDLSAKVLYVSEQPVPLTKSEYSICEYLAKNRGQVFTKEQIYEAVFGFDGIGDNSTISTHIKNIRAKLEHFKISPISTVWGIGYKWE